MNLDFDSRLTVLENEPLSKHSSFKIGGLARYAVFPENKEQMIIAIESARQGGVKHIIVGNGSNLLFDDDGFDGVVIFTKNMSSAEYIHTVSGTFIRAECGRSLTELASETGKKHGLTGLEFAYGIPGTLGGAVYMNAGAYGGQMSDVVIETEYYDPVSNEIKVIGKDEHLFSYRHSVFAEHPEYVILSTLIELKEGDAEEIFAAMSKNINARKEKQPLEYPNAGSTFKRPAGNLFAGKLIEDSGLKGYTVGGAQVSEKHAGFTVNRGGATCRDVLAVIEHTKKTVLEKFGVELECEVIYIPR